MKRNTNDGNGRMASGLWGGMRTIMSGAVKGIILMGLVFSAGACSPSDDEEDGNPVIENGKIKGHEYVDLGLSVKWATCNVGAVTPFDYGNYYAWGEISTKSEYTEDNSVTYGKAMGDICGDPRYDAARANWGGSWRLPMESEFRELVDECHWTWTTLEDMKGYRVVGPNGNSIFLPAAGCRRGSSLYNAGSYGRYWSSTPYKSYSDDAYELYFSSGGHHVGDTYRHYGRPVRPVSE